MTLTEFLRATGTTDDCEQCVKNKKLFGEMQARGELKLDPEPVDQSSIGWKLAGTLMPGTNDFFTLHSLTGYWRKFYCSDSDQLRGRMAELLNQAILQARNEGRAQGAVQERAKISGAVQRIVACTADSHAMKNCILHMLSLVKDSGGSRSLGAETDAVG